MAEERKVLTRQAVRGATRSKTVYLGLAITVLGYLQGNIALIEKLLGATVDPETIELLMAAITMALGMSVTVVRFFTTESLAEKSEP